MRVGTVVNIMKAWGNYQKNLSYYKECRAVAKANNNVKEEVHWDNYIRMTEMEIGEFLDLEI